MEPVRTSNNMPRLTVVTALVEDFNVERGCLQLRLCVDQRPMWRHLCCNLDLSSCVTEKCNLSAITQTC